MKHSINLLNFPKNRNSCGNLKYGNFRKESTFN